MRYVNVRSPDILAVKRLIDLHAHILPGLDDGPADVQGSLALLGAALADGTSMIAATTHLRSDFPTVNPARIAAARAALDQCREEGAAPEVVIAGEVDVTWALGADDEQLRLVSYGQRGTDLLIETPHGQLPPYFEEMLFRIALRGYRLLLAHPEISPDFQRRPERLEALVARGVLLQVTASSLLRSSRRSSRGRLARLLIRRRLAHVLASDAHSAGPWRAPNLTAGVMAVSRIDPLMGPWMAGAAPAAVLSGKPVPPPPNLRRRWSPLRRS